MHIDFALWVYFLSDAMSWNVVSTQVIFGWKLPNYFYLKSDRFPVVSVLNKFMKMYSNTKNIVHSNFRRKEPLYYLFRPYFCHQQTPVLGTYSFLLYFQPKMSQAPRWGLLLESECLETIQLPLNYGWGSPIQSLTGGPILSSSSDIILGGGG